MIPSNPTNSAALNEFNSAKLECDQAQIYQEIAKAKLDSEKSQFVEIEETWFSAVQLSLVEDNVKGERVAVSDVISKAISDRNESKSRNASIAQVIGELDHFRY